MPDSVLSTDVHADVTDATRALDAIVKRARDKHPLRAERELVDVHVEALRGHLHKLVELAGGYDRKAG